MAKTTDISKRQDSILAGFQRDARSSNENSMTEQTIRRSAKLKAERDAIVAANKNRPRFAFNSPGHIEQMEENRLAKEAKLKAEKAAKSKK